MDTIWLRIKMMMNRNKWTSAVNYFRNTNYYFSGTSYIWNCSVSKTLFPSRFPSCGNLAGIQVTNERDKNSWILHVAQTLTNKLTLHISQWKHMKSNIYTQVREHNNIGCYTHFRTGVFFYICDALTRQWYIPAPSGRSLMVVAVIGLPVPPLVCDGPMVADSGRVRTPDVIGPAIYRCTLWQKWFSLRLKLKSGHGIVRNFIA